MSVRKGPRFSWAEVPLADQAKLIEEIGFDGHTIWDADKLKESGLNARAIDQFTTVEKSDGSWKGSIFSTTTGELQAELRGVYGLSLIRSLATYHDIHSHAFGRGTEARQLSGDLQSRLRVLIAAQEAAVSDWEGPQPPEYRESDPEAYDEMVRQDGQGLA